MRPQAHVLGSAVCGLPDRRDCPFPRTGRNALAATALCRLKSHEPVAFCRSCTLAAAAPYRPEAPLSAFKTGHRILIIMDGLY